MQDVGALVAREVVKGHGAETVLGGSSLVVPVGARVGVVGPNGIGKSTLLRVLAGLEEPDSGRVERRPPSLRVGFLPQEPDARHDETLLGYLARRTGLAAAAASMDALAERLGSEPALAGEYTAALDRYLALGGGDLEPRARAVAGELGLAAHLDAPAGALSGGQRARAALAAILLARFDVLLLDEPTNDLDFAGLALLERFLDSTRAAVVLVSHDRTLLERVDRIVELSEDGMREFAGGWSEYAEERERERARRYEAHGRYVDERDRLEEQARRRAEWVVRASSQRRKKKTRDVAGSFERRIARLERAEKPFEPWELRIDLTPAGRAGDVVARLEDAVVERGGFRLGPVDLELAWGERLAVVGPNGGGKTTLLGALLGAVPLASGRRTIGPGVVAGELEQGRGRFAGPASLLEAFTGETGLDPEPARTLLAKFGLGAADVLRPAATLSPGERTRAALASFVAGRGNLLVLDEPTNHLDLPAIEELEEALGRFPGTVVLVSHDRRFMEAFGATRAVAVEDGVVRAV